jgi:catechol 2,3-dioxygenase-like lactoylglutathione lyase family enzyme
MRRRLLAIGATFALAVISLRAGGDLSLEATAIDAVGFTVSDMDRAIDFYTRVLTFRKTSDVEMSGRPFALLAGVQDAQARVVRLRLGDERLELTAYRGSRGRPIPSDFRPNDHAFQHVAIIVSDMAKAYARLRDAGVEYGSPAPQRLPDWNAPAAGIEAFYFRDPDRHFLEILHFPAGKGAAKWQSARGRLFLGIDHTAIVVKSTDDSLLFYRDTLGFNVAGESENYDIEQERLNNVFGDRLRITALRAREGPGIELLEYLSPSDGRPAPDDLRPDDVAHWQTTIVTETLEPLLPLARAHRIALVSPGPVTLSGTASDYSQGVLARDPDRHGVRLVVAPRNLSSAAESKH